MSSSSPYYDLSNLPPSQPHGAPQRQGQVWLNEVVEQQLDPWKVAADKSWAWSRIQAQRWFNAAPVDNWVQQHGPQWAKQLPSSPSLSSMLNLSDDLVNVGDVGKAPYWQQVQQQSGRAAQAVKDGATHLRQNPKALLPATGQLLHSSFTQPFVNLAQGTNVVSSAFSAFSSLMFGYNVINHTTEAHESLKNEGKEGGELWLNTGMEGTKELTKASAVWMAGDVGATLGAKVFGAKVPHWTPRFQNLPAQAAAIVGAVLLGGVTQWVMETLLPKKAKVTKIAQMTL
jgi:hypothetical protein